MAIAPDELVAARIEALFRLAPDGDLIEKNSLERGEAPSVFVTVGRAAVAVAFRTDFARDRRPAIEELVRRRPQADWVIDGVPAPVVEALRSLVSGGRPVRDESQGPAFAFPDRLPEVPEAVEIEGASVDLIRRMVPEATAEALETMRPSLAILDGGYAVSQCYSTRRGAVAHEAGVDTLPEYRRRHLGSRVVAAWARAVRDRGAVPVYSTSFDNVASRALARSAGLVPLAVDVRFTID